MRHLSTFALAGLFGGLLLVGDASACHKKKACTCAPAPAPVCAPAPVVYVAPAPVCAPAPVACAPKKTHHFKMPKMTLHHKKAVCAPTYTASYAAPVSYPTPQSYPSAQATGQSM